MTKETQTTPEEKKPRSKGRALGYGMNWTLESIGVDLYQKIKNMYGSTHNPEKVIEITKYIEVALDRAYNKGIQDQYEGLV